MDMRGDLDQPLHAPTSQPPTSDSPYLIRQARRGEGAAVQQLLEHATPQSGVHRLINGKTQSHPDHGVRLFAVAEADDGSICGAVSAGPMDAWTNGRVEPASLRDLTANAIEVLALAVHPDHRGTALGHRLINWVQETATATGYRLLLVRIDVERPHLADYYSRVGFALIEPGKRWAIVPQPRRQFMIEDFQDGTIGYKPLHPNVRAADVDGVKFMCGVIPGCEPLVRDLLAAS